MWLHHVILRSSNDLDIFMLAGRPLCELSMGAGSPGPCNSFAPVFGDVRFRFRLSLPRFTFGHFVCGIKGRSVRFGC